MKNAKGVGRVGPFSLSRVRNAAYPLPVGFAFYYLFSSLKRYFGLREPIGYCPDYDNRQTRWAKAAVQIVTHDWPPLAGFWQSRYFNGALRVRSRPIQLKNSKIFRVRIYYKNSF
jgi:hypothetical protein